MVLGRIVHYTVDAVFLATVVAGVRRSSGFTLVTYLCSCMAFVLYVMVISHSFRAK